MPQRGGCVARVGQLVVSLDGLGPPPREPEPLGNMAAEGVAAVVRSARRSERLYADRAEMTARRRTLNPRLPNQWVEHLVEHGSRRVEGGLVWKVDPAFSVGVPTGFSVDHVRAEAALVEAPVLFLTGSEPDTWSDLDAGQIAERVGWYPLAQHRSIEGAGHYVHAEEPQAVLAAIEEFLADLE